MRCACARLRMSPLVTTSLSVWQPFSRSYCELNHNESCSIQRYIVVRRNPKLGYEDKKFRPKQKTKKTSHSLSPQSVSLSLCLSVCLSPSVPLSSVLFPPSHGFFQNFIIPCGKLSSSYLGKTTRQPQPRAVPPGHSYPCIVYFECPNWKGGCQFMGLSYPDLFPGLRFLVWRHMFV